MMNLLSNDVGAILGDAGMTILIGMVVVFAVLLLLVAIFVAFGKVMSAGTKNAAPAAPVAAPKATAPVAAPVTAPVVGNTETVRTAPEVQNGIPAETVAVISAAVASVAPAGTQYAVSGIRKL